MYNIMSVRYHCNICWCVLRNDGLRRRRRWESRWRSLRVGRQRLSIVLFMVNITNVACRTGSPCIFIDVSLFLLLYVTDSSSVSHDWYCLEYTTSEVILCCVIICVHWVLDCCCSIGSGERSSETNIHQFCCIGHSYEWSGEDITGWEGAMVLKKNLMQWRIVCSALITISSTLSCLLHPFHVSERYLFRPVHLCMHAYVHMCLVEAYPTVLLSTFSYLLMCKKQKILLQHPFNGLFSRTTWVSQYQKAKISLDLNEVRNDGVLGCSGISWTICKQSAPRSRQTRQHPTTQFFTGRMPFLLPNQQRQSTESNKHWGNRKTGNSKFKPIFCSLHIQFRFSLV